MRRQIIPVVCFVLALTLVPPAACGRGEEGPDRVPAGIDGLVTVRNLAALYDVFGITELRAERPELFEDIDADVTSELGFNPLDVAELDRLGLRTDRAIYVGWMSEPASSMVILLPGGDDLLASMKTLFDEGDGAIAGLGKVEGVEMFGDGGDEVVFYHDESYLYVVALADDEDEYEDEGAGEDDDAESALAAAKALRRQAKKDPLAKSKRYRSLKDKLDKRADIQVYLGEGLNEELMDLGHDEDAGKHGMDFEQLEELYEKWGVNHSASLFEATVAPDRIEADGYTWIGEKSVIHDWYKTRNDPRPFLGRVPSDPMIVMMSRINSAALYRSIRELMALAKNDSVPPFDEQIDDAGKGMGMDLETDLFDQIDGNLGLMINRVQFMGADAVLLMQLADPETFYDTVDGIAGWIELALNMKKNGSPQQGQKAQMTEAEFGGVDYYKVMAPPAFEVCFGIVEDHFVVTVSETRFQAIVGGDGSFVETIGNRRVRETLEEPTGGVFYIDFEGVVRDLKAMAPMLGIEDGEIFEVLGQLSELTSVSRMDKQGMWSNTSLAATAPGVWKRLATWLLEESAAEERPETPPGETTD